MRRLRALLRLHLLPRVDVLTRRQAARLLLGRDIRVRWDPVILTD